MIEQKRYRLRRVIGISYLCIGVLITVLMAVVAIWPGMLVYFLFPDFDWVAGEGATALITNIFLGVGYFMLAIALIVFIGAAPLFAIPIVLLIGIPSIAGGIGLLRNRKWGMRLLVFEAIVYLLIFPLGTLLGIFTLILRSRENKIRTLS